MMDAILTAGGIPQPGEPLYEYTLGLPKAMLDIGGKPMVQWVLDALGDAQLVDHVVLIGLEEDCGLNCSKPLYYLPNQGGMVENLVAGVQKLREANPGVQQVLAVSSDIPALRGEMVDWLARSVVETDDQLYYCVVTRQVMEARFPGSNRSYTRLKDLEACGGDANAFHTSLIDGDLSIWMELANTRKNVFRQAALIGFGTLFLLLLRRLTVQDAIRRVTHRLGVRGRALICPYAEMAMDVDKPHQLELLIHDLKHRTPA